MNQVWSNGVLGLAKRYLDYSVLTPAQKRAIREIKRGLEELQKDLDRELSHDTD